MLSFFKELYLTGFTLNYRFACKRWSHPSNLGKGVGGVVLIETLALWGIEMWIEIHLGKKLPIKPWEILISFAGLWLPNYYALVIRGHGIKYEREFSNLEKRRKTILLVSCTVLVLAVIAFLFVTGSAYQRFFHITPKA